MNLNLYRQRARHLMFKCERLVFWVLPYWIVSLAFREKRLLAYVAYRKQIAEQLLQNMLKKHPPDEEEIARWKELHKEHEGLTRRTKDRLHFLE